MKWLTQIFGKKKKDSKHENHISHTQKQKKTKINDTTYRSDIPNDGFPGGRPEDPRHAKRVPMPHKTEDRHGNFSQATQTHKTSNSVTEQLAFVGDYIDDYNRKTHRSSDRIEIDIIILKGLLDIDQKLTEPKPGTQIKFISNPRKSWRYDLHSAKLRRACAKTKWHTTDPWIPDATLDKAIQEEMFRATEHDKRVYISGMSGIIIRKPPPEYRICQRINRLGDPRSKSQPSSSELSKIVEEMRTYIEHNKLRLEDKQSKLRQKYREQGKKYDINPLAYDCGNHHHQSQGVMIPDKLIEKWQNNYRFNNVHFWLDKIDYHSCQMSLRKWGHRHLIGHVMIVDRSKSRESSSTKSRHDSHRANGPHDSAISVRHDPGSSQRPPPKANTYKSKYSSGSGTSIGGRRRGQSSAQLPSQRELSSTQSSREAPPKNKPSPYSRPTPSIRVDPSDHEEWQGKSPGKSPSRKSPKRSPRTPDKNHVYQNSGVPPLPPTSHSPHRDNQKSPARPGSSSRGMTQKKSHRDLLDPGTLQPQPSSYTYTHTNITPSSKPETVKTKKSHHDLFHASTNPLYTHSYSYSQAPAPAQTQPQLQPHPQINTQINRTTQNEHLKPATTTQNISPVSPLDPKYRKRWEYQTAEQKEEIHRKMMQELRSEGKIDH
ncbi:42596087-987f-457c-af12-bedf33127bdc-CDS [Sclerotinia trifoliorum]|uniref:42596087-987f-457c-af12-bedf33127bdc-CDS n=1 Tax=Sclerotinia trifoliorum TaxID=28548 RepID=A0A8H2VX83_9HELO|nr:42596087-987f-457c-af12-bedf33127bdc-CDS [Sclerotinia trifoliorum]